VVVVFSEESVMYDGSFGGWYERFLDSGAGEFEVLFSGFSIIDLEAREEEETQE